jgi:hypothetical protein
LPSSVIDFTAHWKIDWFFFHGIDVIEPCEFFVGGALTLARPSKKILAAT